MRNLLLDIGGIKHFPGCLRQVVLESSDANQPRKSEKIEVKSKAGVGEEPPKRGVGAHHSLLDTKRTF